MPQQKPSLLHRIFTHIITFGLCVALPVVVMCIMPVASTTFTRTGDTISAIVTRKVFFIIPFLTETVEQVKGVDDQYQAGTQSKTTRSGPVNDPMRPETRSESMSWLVIQGRFTSVEVPVSPANIDEVRRRARDFLQDETQSELRIFTVANWKISVITGAVLTLLTTIYVGSMIWSFVTLFSKKRKNI
ncbi:MAG: hypothetical protein K8R87_12750 [Verrucomicrobia bacterium]|nr:hypothetical protein [Verrucomicrobiota bacterium]